MSALKRRVIGPNHYLLLGFGLIIFLGSILLLLPFSLRQGHSLSYLDSLFISTSAVCVTGLVTVDVAATFTLFGRLVIGLLILLGGLGFASMVISLSLLFGWNIGISKRNMLKEAYNLGSLKGTLQVVRMVGMGALLFQGLGTLIEFFIFRKTYQPLQAFGHALFNTISAFNNAGFDLMGNYSSLTAYKQNIAMNLTTALLIIIGGTGFFVLADIISNRRWKKLSMHSRVVLTMNFVLISLGFIVFFFVERLDVLSAFFQSVTARTAGFNTVDIAGLSEFAQFFLIMLMFIGASPGSTGGGIKTTTTFTLVLSLWSLVFRKEPAAFKRRISDDSIIKAFQVLLLALLVLIFGITGILLVEGNRFSFLQIAFETVSAFATVGLSTGITPSLASLSKLILIAIMFVGRVGPITVATSLRVKQSTLKYVEEQVFIG